ncbi:histidine phosphatase family protein [Paraburkholderia sp. D15]|uniref:histidine phosphatase family protein n=1 Tax=Paraburkholderia sp. D15 TaxID=2880218 RepID=UPI002479A5AC|nr:histidine phosphatase family protein [Paraburkholderia sp. D15]WGS49800.1 histidine phosphatase family protein [Paraburkholderia sp. D15]
MNRFRGFLHGIALAFGGLCIGTLTLPNAHAADNQTGAQTETLVFVRHGEKPAAGYGQLNCQGLNRALALPAVIAAKFGKPDAIYAPDPAQQKDDSGHPYYYIRPLATIEPTAIQFQMPVQTPYGFAQIDQLGTALVNPDNRGKLIVVAWEHKLIVKLLRQMMSAHGGNAADVPGWKSDDFDSIYIVRLDWQNGVAHASFRHDRQGLDGRSTDCPCAALPGSASAVSSASSASSPAATKAAN